MSINKQRITRTGLWSVMFSQRYLPSLRERSTWKHEQPFTQLRHTTSACARVHQVLVSWGPTPTHRRKFQLGLVYMQHLHWQSAPLTTALCWWLIATQKQSSHFSIRSSGGWWVPAEHPLRWEQVSHAPFVPPSALTQSGNLLQAHGKVPTSQVSDHHLSPRHTACSTSSSDSSKCKKRSSYTYLCLYRGHCALQLSLIL